MLSKLLAGALRRRFAVTGVSVAALVMMVLVARPTADVGTVPAEPSDQGAAEAQENVPLGSSTEPASGFTLVVNRQNQFVWPASGPITTYFGLGHPTGIDIGLDPGYDAPVRASAAGTVSFAGGNSCCSYGYHIVIDHNGSTTLYGHLAKISVEVGQDVVQGEVIGLGGSTGESDGKHLHFEIEVGGVVFDPLRFLSAQQRDRSQESATCSSKPVEIDPASLLNLRLLNGSQTDLQIEQVGLSPLTARATFSLEARPLSLHDLEVAVPPIPSASGETYAYRLEIKVKDAQAEQIVACDLSLRTGRTLPNPLTQRRAATPVPPTPTPTPRLWMLPTLTPRPTITPYVRPVTH